MPVQLILDCFGIDNQAARVVEATDADILAARTEIKRHLSNHAESLLRVRLNSPALLRRFRDYEGMDGVLATQRLIPQKLLAQKLRCEIPHWLTDEQIIAADLLQKNYSTEQANTLEEKLLIACDANLLAADFESFIAALIQQTDSFLLLLNVPLLQARLRQHLILGLAIPEEVARLFIATLLKSGSIREFLTTLAYQQHLEQLRVLNKNYTLNQALPAKVLDSSLLQALPILDLSEQEALNLPEKFNAALLTLERKIVKGELSPESMCEALQDWSLLLISLESLIAGNRVLITPALLDKLQKFSSPQSQELLKKLQQPDCALLDATASVDEVISWSASYFDYCRQAFLDKNTPTEAINLSFTEWLLAQPARICRSEHDWRFVSTQVCRYLEQAYVVVIIMVDALSALNQDIVLEELTNLNHLILQQDILFAPLPTLTVVGKMAVLTGQTAQSLSGNQESCLQSRYQDYLNAPQSLKVLKSWVSADENQDEHINKHTQLMVYFENRLDDRLHDCVNFGKHREDIRPIVKQLKRFIDERRRDVAYLNKEVVFFITADHGMTVTQNLYAGASLGEIKERVFKLNTAVDLPDGFVKINDYAVPKSRLRLTPNALLTHGGLTPEEVLIPFISLVSKPPPAKTPLEVGLSAQMCKKLGSKQWQLELTLTASLVVDSINITLAAPFSGKCSIDSLRANRSQNLLLNFSSEQEQEGLTELTLLLSYHYAGAFEENQKLLSVHFPASLLEKDTTTQNFEDMF